MINYKEREDYRGHHEDSEASSTEGVELSAGGEATDPHQLVMWYTRVSADKAVAHILGRVPWDE